MNDLIERVAVVREYLDRHGHWPSDRSLHWDFGWSESWIGQVRSRYRKGKLTAEQVSALDTVEFPWDVIRGRNKALPNRLTCSECGVDRRHEGLDGDLLDCPHRRHRHPSHSSWRPYCSAIGEYRVKSEDPRHRGHLVLVEAERFGHRKMTELCASCGYNREALTTGEAFAWLGWHGWVCPRAASRDNSSQ
jgi:hypothetical protein